MSEHRKSCICPACVKADTIRTRESLDAKAALFDEMLAALKMVEQRWTFDNRQYHTHNWHDMQDCRAVIIPLLTKANKIIETV